MMSNKRGPEDIHGDGTFSLPQSEAASPKRSKLDFLAMIAEMSEKKEETPKEAAVPVAPAQPEIVVEQTMEKTPNKSESKSVGKKSSKTDGPKSSFAAWKLAKGRKNGSKSPNRKDITVGRQNNEIVTTATETVTPTCDAPEAPMAALKKAIEMRSSAAAAAVVTPTTSSLLDPMEALAAAAASRGREMITPPLLPPKKALRHKDPSNKKSVSPKKAGSSIKKDKEGMSAKKSAKKKAAAEGSGKVKGSGKSKSKKGDQSSGKTSTFPEKIMELLQGNLASNAIYWLPEGEAIAVDPDNFKDSTVISKQFRGNKLSSFVRSLNRWGFRRIFYHSLPDKTLAFYHRLFQKQAPLLVKEMKMDGGEKEPALPPGALPSSMMVDGKSPPVAAQAEPKPEESPVSVRQTVTTPVESAPNSPAVPAPAPSAQVSVSEPASPPTVPVPQDPVLSAVLSAAQPGAAQSMLERASALELAEGQHALQQAMLAEQERSDLALQQLQAQQFLLQSLAEQQSATQAEELLMQSMLAEQQRSDLALQQHQAEQALIQQMLAEEQTAALAAALNGSAGAGGLNAEALLRERLLAQQYASSPAPGSDILALLQQQLQGQQQPAREPSYMEQLLLLEQQQQQQRQHEAALLAAHGFRF